MFRIIAAVLFLGPSTALGLPVDCGAFDRFETDFLTVGGNLPKALCECAEITDSDIERLACFDSVASEPRFVLMQAQLYAELLRRIPGGIEAMESAIELGPNPQ